MFNTFLSFFLIYGLKSNILINSGSGALLFEKENQYLKFRLLNSLFVAIGLICCLIISYFLYTFVYMPSGMLYLNVLLSVLIVGIYNIIVSKIFAKMSKLTHYLYEKSYSFAFDMVFILSVIFTVNMSFALLDFIVMAVAIAVAVFVSNMIFGAYIEDSNKTGIDQHYLNVPARLFMLAIFSIILYYASQLLI